MEEEMKTNESYHSNRTHLSSSMLKLLLTDRQRFYETWVLNITKDDYKPQFEEGSVTHSLILEPEKVAQEYAFFEGVRRAGKAYEQFCEDNPGKKVITTSLKARAEKHRQALLIRPEAVALLQNGHAEHTILGEILGIPVKARADYINAEAGIICDIKTTSYPSDVEIFKGTVKEFMYDLSAALYKQIAEQVYQKEFSFYWIVISKSDNTCHVYKAASETLRFGTSLLMKALITYKQSKETGNYLDSTNNTLYTDSTSMYEIMEV